MGRTCKEKTAGELVVFNVEDSLRRGNVQRRSKLTGKKAGLSELAAVFAKETEATERQSNHRNGAAAIRHGKRHCFCQN